MAARTASRKKLQLQDDWIPSVMRLSDQIAQLRDDIEELKKRFEFVAYPWTQTSIQPLTWNRKNP